MRIIRRAVAAPEISCVCGVESLATSAGADNSGKTDMDDIEMVAWPIAYAISATTFVVGLGALVAVVVFAS